MLTLLPLSGLQDALKKRNNTTLQQFGDRRGSIAVYEDYSLPSSKASMRRFSSYEQLAPIFQQILAQEPISQPSTRDAALAAPPSPTSEDRGPVSPPSLIKSRRGSITAVLKGSFRRRRSVPTLPEYNIEATCNDLDAQIARLKDQLAQFKSEDLDISQRVDDLSSSVEDMYRQNSNDGCDSSQDCLYHRLRQEKMQIRRSQSFQQFQASTSTSGLQSISESVNESSDSEIDEDDEQAFESCSQSSLSWANCSRPTSYSSEMQDPAATPTFAEDKINTKEYCLLNNTVKPRARSTSQLNLITNDLSRTGSADCTSKRLSVMSDSVLLMHHHHLPELYSLSKEQQHEL